VIVSVAHLDDDERALVLGVLNPPTKRPLVALMKQARAFGVGVIVAMQNPMDLDYRALGNAGLWCLGRLQTDADRARVLDGLGAGSVNGEASLDGLGDTLRRLAPRWFVTRDAHVEEGTVLLQPRWAMSFLRGPMTRNEIRAALGGRGAGRRVERRGRRRMVLGVGRQWLYR
jgi:hypothetical protein